MTVVLRLTLPHPVIEIPLTITPVTKGRGRLIASKQKIYIYPIFRKASASQSNTSQEESVTA